MRRMWTRSGKGLHIVIPAILDAPDAVVTTSNRPDNLTATLRYAGKLLRLGIGRAHTDATIIILIHANNTIVISTTTGEIIAEHTIDPTHNYQPKKPTPTHQTGTMT